MSRSSQTDLAVLAALTVAPLTGYALRAAIKSHLGAFWSESFGQIYPALSRLSEAGLIELDEGQGRRASSVYRLTPTGRSRLVELMREPITSTPPRNGLLLRLFFGDALGAIACRGLVAEARVDAERMLDSLAEARRDAESVDPGNPHAPYWLITISAGEHSARAAMHWCDETLTALDRLIRSEAT